MSHVFLSYSRKDAKPASTLADRLHADGIDVWFDLEDISAGAHWDDRVKEALQASTFVIVFLSPNSVASDQVKNEIAYAEHLKKSVVPVMHKKCEPPILIFRKQFVDYTLKGHESYHQILSAIGQVQYAEDQIDSMVQHQFDLLLDSARSFSISELTQELGVVRALGIFIIRQSKLSAALINGALFSAGWLVFIVALGSLAEVSRDYVFVLFLKTCLPIVITGGLAGVIINWFSRRVIKAEIRQQYNPS
ncbi:MAG: toll/interleukin-1 receptor domain-containing protein [Candidatus Thiodiazotropha sp. (ex Lucinoma borealis)]|nr:toll/interleukin-1 receptor domain-containing protein [Candidatus Thiodiazotropha sp. (ex Lucinoma borealis)]